MTRKTRIAIAALSAMSVLAVPSVGQAKNITFGIRLDHEPSNSVPAHNCREDGSEDPTPACTRVATDAGAAVKAGLRAPKDGTIVQFRVRAGAPGRMTFRLARLRNLGFNPDIARPVFLGRAVGTGPTVNVQGRGFDETGNPVESFKANLKVRKGDYLGIDSTSTSALYCSGGGANQAIFSPRLGKARSRSATTDGCELLVQAVMKPAPKKKRR
jgi:hypothetical protein